MVKSGFLKVYPSINAKFNEDFHQPCVVFASHPSLRFGEACHFVELWKNSPANSFIFIEPEFYYLDSLAPYQPIYANFYYFPIDTCLSTNQVHKLIKETKQVTQLVVSSQYKLNEQAMSTPNDESAKIDPARLSANTAVNYYTQNDIVKLVLKRRYENCDIEADLAGMLIPFKTSEKLQNENHLNNISYSTFNAQLVTKNNRHLLRAAPKTIPLSRRDRMNESSLKKYTYGKLNILTFLFILRQAGLSTFKLFERDEELVAKEILVIDEASLSGKKVSIEIDKANGIEIDLLANNINVNCENEEYRVKVKDCLLKCLNTL